MSCVGSATKSTPSTIARSIAVARQYDQPTMSDPPSVRYEVTGRIARLTLNRPERGNGITLDLVRELGECVERADLDPAVHVLLLAGEGPGFCAGYDLVESAGRVGEAAHGEAAQGGAGAGAGSPAGGSPPPGSPLDPEVTAANH